MKKYIKPELFYESFELSEQIAIGCSSGLLANYSDISNCEVEKIYDVPMYLFVDSNADCKANNFEGYCYTVGADGMTIFTS